MQQLSGTYGSILHISCIYQWNPGIFPRHGEYEHNAFGDVCPDRPAGGVCIPSGAWDWNAGRGICLCHRMERHAFGRNSLLFLVYEGKAVVDGGKLERFVDKWRKIMYNGVICNITLLCRGIRYEYRAGRLCTWDGA